MLFYMAKGLCKYTQDIDLKMKIILDYLGGPNAITMAPVRGIQVRVREGNMMTAAEIGVMCSEGVDGDNPPEAEKSRKHVPSLKPSRRNQP